MANLKDLIVNGSARVIGKLFAQTPASNTNNNEVATTSFVCNVGDGKSISKSSNNKLQAIGVLDAQNTANALKTWTGTKAQYDAIATKDNNTIYHITDDTDVTLTLLNTLYPVGAIYIGTCANCPLQVLGVGTWALKSDNFITRELVEKKEPTGSDPTWYNLYSDGWCEQGGLYDYGSLVKDWNVVDTKFLKNFLNTNYSLNVQAGRNDSNINSINNQAFVTAYTTNNFKTEVYGDGNSQYLWWHACGYTSAITTIPQYKKWERVS